MPLALTQLSYERSTCVSPISVITFSHSSVSLDILANLSAGLSSGVSLDWDNSRTSRRELQVCLSYAVSVRTLQLAHVRHGGTRQRRWLLAVAGPGRCEWRR